MKLDIRIMGVRSRMMYIRRLANHLNVPASNIVIDDRGPGGGGDAWYNAKRAWTAPTGEATHRLVIQDDVIVCNGFVDICNQIIEQFPDAVFAFSCGAWIKPEMRKTDSPYVRLRGSCISAQAIIMPVKLIPDMIAWSDDTFGPEYKHDDGRIGWYCAYHDIPTYTVIPSLVEHLQIDSVIPHHNRKDRNCRTWIGTDIGEQDFTNINASVTGFRPCNMWLNPEDQRFPAVKSMMCMAAEKARAIC